MATVICLNIPEPAPLVECILINISPNRPYNNQFGDRAVIAKGNMIKGIKAEW